MNSPTSAVAGKKVVILDFDPGKHFDVPDVERSILGEDVNLAVIRTNSRGQVTAQLIDADVIIVWSRFELDAGLLTQLQGCLGIVCASVGYDHVDLEVAASQQIPICNIPDYGTEEVADHTMALLLAVVRNLTILDRAVRAGTWDWKVGGPSRRLRGQRLGIVGFGRIGTAFARRAAVFGLDVAFFDPFVASGVDKSHGVRRHETLAALLDDSDIVSLHAQLNAFNTNIMDRSAFARLRRGALFLNTARGDLVDTQALVDALSSGQLGGAGLDVFAGEPEVPEALLRAQHVVLTPHSAWSSTQSFAENRQKSARAAMRLLRGQPLRDVVNGVGVSTNGRKH